MLPLRATSGVSGVAGSVAVDEKMSVSAFEKLRRGLVLRAEGELRLWPVSTSRRNSFCDPLMRAR